MRLLPLTLVVLALAAARPVTAGADACAAAATDFLHAADNLAATAIGHDLERRHVAPRRAAVRRFVHRCRPQLGPELDGDCAAALAEIAPPGAPRDGLGAPEGWRAAPMVRPLLLAYARLAAAGCFVDAAPSLPWEALLLWVEPYAAPLRGRLLRRGLAGEVACVRATPQWAALEGAPPYGAARAALAAAPLRQAVGDAAGDGHGAGGADREATSGLAAALPPLVASVAWQDFAAAYGRCAGGGAAGAAARLQALGFVRQAAAHGLVPPLPQAVDLVVALSLADRLLAAPAAATDDS